MKSNCRVSNRGFSLESCVRKRGDSASSSPVHATLFLFLLSSIFLPLYPMDHFHRITATLAAGAISLAIPASSLAFGLGFGFHSQSNTEVSADSTGSSLSADADVDAKIAARCKHLSGNDRTQCEASVRAYLDAKANTSDARSRMRTVISNLRHRVHEVREDGKSALARVRVFLSDLRAQLNAALNTETELALKVCKDKEGDEHDTCVADAKVKLQSKVNAAIEAMKK